MPAKTVKAKWRLANSVSKFTNIPVTIHTAATGKTYIGMRIGSSGNLLSLRPDQARLLADHLHDRADQVDELNRKGNR